MSLSNLIFVRGGIVHFRDLRNELMAYYVEAIRTLSLCNVKYYEVLAPGQVRDLMYIMSSSWWKKKTHDTLPSKMTYHLEQPSSNWDTGAGRHTPGTSKFIS